MTDYLKTIHKIFINYERDINEWNILALRGVSILSGKIIENDNKPDYYNDLLCINKGNELKYIRGTIDPGSKYTMAPLDPGGAFHLKDGLIFFERGIHMDHEAFVESGEFSGWRDHNKNFIFDDGDKEVKVKSSINFHAGSGGQRIGGWSAGCVNTQAAWIDEDWIWIHDTLYRSLQEKFPMVIMDGKGFLAIV